LKAQQELLTAKFQDKLTSKRWRTGRSSASQQSTIMGWILQTNSAEGINGALGTQPKEGCRALP
jgi:hypothetical protein